MKKIIKLTESDLVRLIERVVNEQTISPINYHRFRDGGNPGIEDFFKTNNLGIYTFNLKGFTNIPTDKFK